MRGKRSIIAMLPHLKTKHNRGMMTSEASAQNFIHEKNTLDRLTLIDRFQQGLFKGRGGEELVECSSTHLQGDV